LLKISTIEEVMMATVNFSVPDDVKDAFNEAYKGQNKSAVIADLMREAVERAQRKQRSHEAIARIVERRKHAPAMTDEELRAARENGRP
jgi:metal-responsive CopG/Arc/MetJ family transcriptional regulator